MLRKRNFSSRINICLYSSVAERWSCKPKVMSSILIGGTISFFHEYTKKIENLPKVLWPRRDSNTQPSDLESDALPLRHGVNQVPPRFELGSLDSKSRVLTITPWNLAYISHVKNKVRKLDKARELQNYCFLPGSNRRPCACEAHVITTTLRKHQNIFSWNFVKAHNVN